VDTAVLMEIESLRRASLAGLRENYREVFQEEARSRHREHLFRRIAWRLQALAEGDLSERARARAHEIAQDADLRIVAPHDFFTVSGERVRTTSGDRNRRNRITACLCRALCSAGRGKAGPFWWRSLGRASAMRTSIILRSAQSRLP
jgi:hypothetical protein